MDGSNGSEIHFHFGVWTPSVLGVRVLETAIPFIGYSLLAKQKLNFETGVCRRFVGNFTANKV